MTEIVTVTLDVEVDDPSALWRKAWNYMRALDDDGQVLQGEEARAWAAETEGLIGTEDKPDVGACLQMLLDRSEHLDGAEIQQSNTDWSTPDDDEEDESGELFSE